MWWSQQGNELHTKHNTNHRSLAAAITITPSRFRSRRRRRRCSLSFLIMRRTFCWRMFCWCEERRAYITVSNMVSECAMWGDIVGIKEVDGGGLPAKELNHHLIQVVCFVRFVVIARSGAQSNNFVWNKNLHFGICCCWRRRARFFVRLLSLYLFVHRARVVSHKCIYIYGFSSWTV